MAAERECPARRRLVVRGGIEPLTSPFSVDPTPRCVTRQTQVADDRNRQSCALYRRIKEALQSVLRHGVRRRSRRPGSRRPRRCPGRSPQRRDRGWHRRSRCGAYPVTSQPVVHMAALLKVVAQQDVDEPPPACRQFHARRQPALDDRQVAPRQVTVQLGHAAAEGGPTAGGVAGQQRQRWDSADSSGNALDHSRLSAITVGWTNCLLKLRPERDVVTWPLRAATSRVVPQHRIPPLTCSFAGSRVRAHRGPWIRSHAD